MTRNQIAAAVASVALCGSCGYSGSGGGDEMAAKASDNVPVPTITAGSTFSFDLGTVVNGKYYLTDRNNKAVDVIDARTHALTQITGSGALAFSGCTPNANCVGANNGKGGPDGINWITGTNLLYVGDVNGVKVVDISTQSVVKAIPVGTTGFRADEGCYDPDDHLYMISTPDADQPFASFIDTTTQTVVATVNWVDTNGTPAGGNEQCQYDHASHSFLVNNDNTLQNPHGEVDVIPVSSIQAIPAGGSANVFSLAGVNRFPLGNCDPTGLDLGPGNEIIVECRQGDAKAALTSIFMDRRNGSVIATTPTGGGDQVAYDAASNKYYITAGRWHASGMNDLGGGCSTNNPCVPTLFVIDASSHAIVKQILIGNGAHSVAVDPATGQIFVPYSSATAPGGCPGCAALGVTNGGIYIYTI